jgi:ethanolamine transporter EutH
MTWLAAVGVIGSISLTLLGCRPFSRVLRKVYKEEGVGVCTVFLILSGLEAIILALTWPLLIPVFAAYRFFKNRGQEDQKIDTLLNQVEKDNEE